MALHEQLFPRLVGAIRGQRNITPLGITGGSVNYRLMDAATAYITMPTTATRSRAMSLMLELEEVGHFCLRGPSGIACEQGSPGMHWTFNMASVIGIADYAESRNHMDLYWAAMRVIQGEAALCAEYRYGPHVIMPAPRVKDEIDQGPIDGYRDVFTKLAFGEKVKKPNKYWSQDSAIAVSTFRNMDVHFTPGIALPKLYVPIHKVTHDDGFLAWVDDTPEARAVMGHDCCNWVLTANGQYKWGYDWSPVPGQG